ncbi:MAG: nucleoside triphosphate pyrophosphohydrolase [Cyanobacteria bacterium J06628_6]
MPNPTESLQRLIDVVAQLRNPDGGCPWDLKQTPESLVPYVTEEAYEVVDAIQRGDRADIAEELGDLLLQVMLQSQIFSEEGAFDIGDVAEGIAEKLIRRHPHVFGDSLAETPEEVKQAWEKIKAEEKGGVDETQLTPKLERYGRTLPPMRAAMKISIKAAKAGFEWEDLDGVWAKVHEELDEFRAALANEPVENQEAELGDVLFSLIQIARWRGLDPVAALQGTNRRFTQRFGLLESAAEKPLAEHSIEELEALWQTAKRQLKQTLTD